MLSLPEEAFGLIVLLCLEQFKPHSETWGIRFWVLACISMQFPDEPTSPADLLSGIRLGSGDLGF